MIGDNKKRNELEELKDIGIGLQSSLQSSMDMLNQTLGGSLLEERERFHKFNQINGLENLAIDSKESFLDSVRIAIEQTNTHIETLGLGETFISETMRKAIEEANPYISSALGFSETLAYQASRDSLLNMESPIMLKQMGIFESEKLIAEKVISDYAIEERERLKELNKISVREEFDFQSMMDYAKGFKEHDTFKVMEKLANEVAIPIKSYTEQMQIALGEPLKSISKEIMSGLGTIQEFSKVHSEFSDLYKPQMEIASESIRTLQENLNEVWNTPNIQDMSAFLSTTVDSYRSIHDVLDHKSIANMFPANMDLLIQGLIDAEPLTQQYLRTIHNRPIAIEEPNVLIEIEAIKSEILESIHEGNQQLNQAIEKLYAFVLSQKDPKIILFLQQYLLPIVLGIITWLIIDYGLKPTLEPILKNDKLLIKKNLTKRLKTYIPNPKERIQYRIVNVDRLNIREGQSRKTEIISHLAFADVVQIIKKKKNWILIKKYNEEQETVIQGWVFTRYLTPIK